MGSAEELAAEVDRLREEVATLQQEKHDEAARLREENALLKQQRDDLEARVRDLRARIFGKKTERFADHPLLPFPDDIEEPEAPPHVDEAPDDECDEIETSKPKKKRRSRGAPRLGPTLERVEEMIEPSEEERSCSCCSEQREIIGYETTEKLECNPANYFIRVIRRPKLVCKKHEEAGVVTPELPPQAIHKGLAGESMLAHVITSKYRDHLPLYRQSQIARRHGVELSESTLGDWIRQSAELLQPVVTAMHKRIVRGNYVASDDTSITVLGGAKRKGSKRAFLWSYVGDKGDVVFDFTSGRSRDGPKRMLEGFRGYHQADAYSGYKPIYENGDIVEVGCMAHARRRFHDAMQTSREHATTALHAIRRLYEIERDARDLEPEERHSMRQSQALPIFDDFHNWLLVLSDHVLPKSPIGKAITYFVRNAKALHRYLDDPALRIDNNRVERTMRQVAVGRKNWLFAGSEEGGHRAAVLYSLTVSCWEVSLDPFAYLTDVLRRLSTTPSADVESLTPRDWHAANPQ